MRLIEDGPRITRVLDDDGSTLGRVLKLSATYRASRRSGTDEDVRRLAYGFRSVDSAVRWITTE